MNQQEIELGQKFIQRVKDEKISKVANLIAKIYRTGYDQGFHEANKENFDTFEDGWLEEFKEIVKGGI